MRVGSDVDPVLLGDGDRTHVIGEAPGPDRAPGPPGQHPAHGQVPHRGRAARLEQDLALGWPRADLGCRGQSSAPTGPLTAPSYTPARRDASVSRHPLGCSPASTPRRRPSRDRLPRIPRSSSTSRTRAASSSARRAAEAELDYHLNGSRLVLVHTEVPAALGGHGLGGRLVRAALDRAGREGLTVVPVVPIRPPLVAGAPGRGSPGHARLGARQPAR